MKGQSFHSDKCPSSVSAASVNSNSPAFKFVSPKSILTDKGWHSIQRHRIHISWSNDLA